MTQAGLSLGHFGARSSEAPGAIDDLVVTTLTPTSVNTNFTAPTGTITSYQYRLDGGAEQVLSGGPGGSITNLVTGVARDVEVRAMNGSTPGPWSNVATADPGCTINIVFDNNGPLGNGENPGSWSDHPANLATTSGTKSWPEVGFSSAQDVIDATATVLQWRDDMRRFIGSTGSITLMFGMGRMNSLLTLGNFSWTYGSGVGVIQNGGFNPDRVTVDYAGYRTLVSQLPYAEQRACFRDPGSFPWGGTTMDIQKMLYALINNTVETNVMAVGFNPFFGPFDWDSNLSACASGKRKAYPLIMHDATQQWFRFGGGRWPNWLAYKGLNDNWINGNAGNPYNSIDLGQTNLGTGIDFAGSKEPFDWLEQNPLSGAGPSSFMWLLSNYASNPLVPGATGAWGTNAGTPVMLDGRALPLRAGHDDKMLFALLPATELTKGWAGF